VLESLIKIINFNSFGDERGSLVALEADRNIPFPIKRLYYIFDTKAGVSRGFHAHRELKQVAVAVKGSCRFVLDNGTNRESVVLDNPLTGLLIDSFVWREMHEFSEDCVLLVFASAYYDEADYIRNYDDFLLEVK
jgi:dTDP-4-dehydrorhamnose 3,5-epimerase-like enzyme